MNSFAETTAEINSRLAMPRGRRPPSFGAAAWLLS
jgi:hypothetical protein